MTTEAPGMLDVGLYVNLFKVNLKSVEAEFAIVKRSQHSNLKVLRETLAKQQIEAAIYAADDKVYGYGSDLNHLAHLGFTAQTIDISKSPNTSSL